jgi:regulator of cell morphogenesis and NO signaling
MQCGVPAPAGGASRASAGQLAPHAPRSRRNPQPGERNSPLHGRAGRPWSFAKLAREIEESAHERGDGGRDWTRESLPTLIDHIVSIYHADLREELPRLERLAARVRQVHGEKAPEVLARIEAIVGELSADLHDHMRKEELVLFPAIRDLAAPARTRRTIPLAPPIAIMEQEHDRAGELLSELRAITGGYSAPAWACATSRALYEGLDELEREMHLHVHLENNIPFPAALRLADPSNVH